jgi:hypothetical protein
MLLGATKLDRKAQDRSCERGALLNQIIELFQTCYPSITIRLLDEVAAVNAQASRLRGACLVDIFGGFAFHPEVGVDALIFLLLHEIGHHLGSGPRMTIGSELACDCAADSWAIVEGLASIATHGIEVDVALAMNQLERALFCASPHALNAAKFYNQKCWCLDWSRRKLLLSSGEIPTIQCCSLFTDKNAPF